MNFDELVASVGADRYRAACEWAWRTRGNDEPWPDALSNVPHDLAGLWSDGSTTLSEKLDLALRLYAEMPCYANTMSLRFNYDDLDRELKQRFWDTYRAALDSPDTPLAEPVAYSLWVDFFEDPSTVAEAWREMTREPSDLRLQRLLGASGPVPWADKQALFVRLVGDPSWHPHIFRALVGSAFDYYGKIDVEAARRWLERLTLPEGTPDVAKLRAKLDAAR